MSFDVAALADPAEPTPIVLLRGHTDLITGAVFNPDGSRVVTTSLDATVRVWDSLTGQELVMLQLDQPGFSLVPPAGFTAGGTRIIAVTNDGVVHIWDSVPDRLRRADHFRSKLGYPGDPSVSRWIRMATGRPSWSTPETTSPSR